jgi:enamine deaminase RidA (YjgF/YER057c/UK114 family)
VNSDFHYPQKEKFMSVESRLAALGIHLMTSSPPIGKFTYVPAKRVGSLVYVSGQLPRKVVDGSYLQIMTGKVGKEISTECAKAAAALCGVSVLSVLQSMIGSLDDVTSVVRVEGFVNSTSEFGDHPEVMNGCSDLFVAAFGPEIGSHTRTAVGCSSLPLGACVEVSAIFEVRGSN